MPPLPPVTVRRLRPDDWREFRQIRLRALADAPAAFSSTLEQAGKLDEAAWRGRLAGRAQFIAESGGRPVGTAAGLEEGRAVELISMWVDPQARGAGVGDLLVKAVLDWARAGGKASIVLWVVEGNLPAERLYRRHGFARSGSRQPVDPAEPGRQEFEMRLSL